MSVEQRPTEGEDSDAQCDNRAEGARAHTEPLLQIITQEGGGIKNWSYVMTGGSNAAQAAAEEASPLH
jgi:fructoselysine-6-P-deglycase FrlB-like protein